MKQCITDSGLNIQSTIEYVMTDRKIAIYLSYHKNTERIDSEIIHPIHVGRKIAPEETVSQLMDIIGDDTGDNISDKNPTFCELTAQYWVWKNRRSDYVGFFHYRRHVSFSNKFIKENKWGLTPFPYICDDYLRKIEFNDDAINKATFDADIITVKQWDVRNAGSLNNYDHYMRSSPFLHIEDYENAIQIMTRIFPDYKVDADEYNSSKFGYYTNIFIMKWEIFDDYCNFLFKILFELESMTDISGYNVQEKRIFGYISEWLFGIYITHYKRTTGKKVKELPRTIVMNADINQDFCDIYSTTDDNYARHLGVLISSIKINKGVEKIRYWILCNNVSSNNIKKLKSLQSDDFLINIVQVDDFSMTSAKNTLRTNSHLSLTVYLRIFIERYVPHSVNKILYLDCDMICRGSLVELYSEYIDDVTIIGVKDILEGSNKKRLRVDKYINSGVMLINLKRWREKSYCESIVDYINKNINDKNKLFYQDQDAINACLSNDIKYTLPKWNAQTSPYPNNEEQNEIGKTSVIVHFISDKKPWIANSNTPFSDEYYDYLKLSPWSDEPLIVSNRNKKQRDLWHFHKKISAFSNKYSKEHYTISRTLFFFNWKLGYQSDFFNYFDLRYMNGKIPSKIIEQSRKMAEDGNPDAAIRMARLYKDGNGVDVDFIESFKWFDKAVKLGNHGAIGEFSHVIPKMFDNVYVSAKDLLPDVVVYIKKMAEDGNPDAAIRMARLYKDGNGVDL